MRYRKHRIAGQFHRPGGEAAGRLTPGARLLPMRATTIHAARDIRVGEVPDPRLKRPTDAIVKVTAGCICGSDLWPYRGENPIRPGATIGHECIGIVEEVGAEVRDFRAGDYVIVPF